MRYLRSRRLAVVTLLIGTLATLATAGVAGCSAESGKSSSDSAAGARPPAAPATAGSDLGNTPGLDAKAGPPNEQAQAEPAPTGSGQASNGQPGSGQATKPGDTGTDEERAGERSIIYTGTITVRVDDVNVAAAKAGSTAGGIGGFVGGDQRTIDARRSQATLTLRVPSKKFHSVLAELHNLGKEESRSVQTEDVTEQVADLDARIATARASVERVRALLAKAQTIGEIVSLESELSRREANLESLEGRMRKLSDLTELSTITLVLLGPDAKQPEKQSDESGFVGGLKRSWNAFVASLVVLLTVIGALLPWVIALGVPAVGIVRLIRRLRRRGRRAAAVRPAPAPFAPAPFVPGPAPARPAPATARPAPGATPPAPAKTPEAPGATPPAPAKAPEAPGATPSREDTENG